VSRNQKSESIEQRSENREQRDRERRKQRTESTDHRAESIHQRAKIQKHEVESRERRESRAGLFPKRGAEQTE
jgi:hypothetical protein